MSMSNSQTSPSKTKTETSKRLAYCTLTLYAVSIGLCFLILMLFTDAASYAVELMGVITPACVAILTCYFGKAGFENYNKYKKAVSSTEEEEDSENG